MSIYLYVKTHNITGLKYFGRTIKKDPYSYLGSGKYWLKHLKTHGHDISTEIVGCFENVEECMKVALEFSRANNIVSSDEWANLIEENGLGGCFPKRPGSRPDLIIRNIGNKYGVGNKSNKGRIFTEEERRNISIGHKGVKKTEEHRKNISVARKVMMTEEYRKHISNRLKAYWVTKRLFELNNQYSE